ncbi:carbohydrate kinase family protein [Sphingomonas adhaesiva]|uniref:carbohydrate kinase family protein n=1 Tax=Sphingomonas adhaesiva TaxID=28212 RepID=UPI002FF71D9F
MTFTMDLLAIGLTTIDIAMHPVDTLPPVDAGVLVDTIRLSPAGTAGGVAMVAAALGLRVAIASAVGDDLQGVAVRHGLAAAGVDTRFLAIDAARPTSSTILPVRSVGQRSTYHMVGASMFAALPDALDAMLPSIQAVHWGAVHLPGVARQGPAFLRRARAAGAFVTCDLTAPREGTMEDLARILPFVDLFMPSLAEVVRLHGDDDLHAAAARFMAMGAGGCVFKLGAQGSILLAPGREVRMAALPIDPVDTTTCGDSFCAGFHAARLNGLDEEDCLRFATATAAQVAMGVGTLGALSDFAATRALSRQIGPLP